MIASEAINMAERNLIDALSAAVIQLDMAANVIESLGEKAIAQRFRYAAQIVCESAQAAHQEEQDHRSRSAKVPS